MGTLRHFCLDVRGVLKNWKTSQLRGLFKHPDGRRMSASEARDVLLDELSKGHVVIPCGPPCDGFDYTGGGCPGHNDAEVRPCERFPDSTGSSAGRVKRFDL